MHNQHVSIPWYFPLTNSDENESRESRKSKDCEMEPVNVVHYLNECHAKLRFLSLVFTSDVSITASTIKRKNFNPCACACACVFLASLVKTRL